MPVHQLLSQYSAKVLLKVIIGPSRSSNSMPIIVVNEVLKVNAILVPYTNINCVYILVEVSLWISTTWWVSLLVDHGVSECTWSQVLRSTSVDSWRFESINFSVFKIHWNCNIVGLLHHPFWLYLVLPLFWHLFSYFKLLCLAKDQWREFSTRDAHMVHFINLIRFKMVYTS